MEDCKRCPRLRAHCLKVAREKRKSFQDWKYWGLPVPNFGDPKAQLLIVGLAPAAHGANRTGRMFTGDRSGEWLYKSLHNSSFANQSHSESIDDGLKLSNALITAVAHCAPPDNKPSLKEIENCRPFLSQTFSETPFQVVVALGKIAWDASWRELRDLNLTPLKKTPFGHSSKVELEDGRYLIGSYHPSQQNTFTGRLTEAMFDSVFMDAKKLITKLKTIKNQVKKC